MEDRALVLLELPKVLARLSALAVSEAGQKACLALRPGESPDEAQRKAAWFSQGRIWRARTGFTLLSFPPLDGVLRFLESPAALLDLDALWALRRTLIQAKEVMLSLRGEESPGFGRRPESRANAGEASDGPEQFWPLLAERARSFTPPAQVMAALARCLGDDGHLRDEASPELGLARSGIRSLHQMCTRRVKEFIQRYNLEQYLQDEFMTLSSDRYVLPLKANFKGRLQGVIHDYSQTGETCYFEPIFLMEVNNRLQELRREEREAELKVLRYLTDLVRGELAGIREVYALLVDMDVVLAVSHLATLYDGNSVEFDEGRPMHLVDARHPLLALQHKTDPKGAPKPVPVDLTLRLSQRALIVSGGNAGGKTVGLKTLGLIALMGMCGLPVPAGRGGSLPFWRRMHVFIGDEQSLEDHVSTYTAQIRHLARIWDRIDAHSLVILDEFGAGTDPAQGAALAQAVVDGLLERGAYVVAATHFPALKAYALSRDAVRAASVLFDPKTKKPLFRLAYDQVGASQALDVAKEHGLPGGVLRRAEQYLLLDGADTSALVERLNALAVEREKELHDLAAERTKLHEKRLRLDERFAKEREALFARIQTEAQTVLRDWKASRISHKQTLKELAKTRKSVLAAGEGEAAREAAPQERLDAAALRPEMDVHYLPWAKNGRVVDVDSRRGKVRLDLSGVTLWAEIADCAPAAAGKKAAQAPKGGVRIHSTTNMPLRLDLRGMRADVAVAELERFLDAAILNGRTNLEILHGRGTGALRREVHGALRRFSAVESFTVAPEDQGGDGVTHVVLA